ncbi:hypothetical protein ACP70R_038659 [Stipagrostis hirtigluma subsp. patula]
MQKTKRKRRGKGARRLKKKKITPYGFGNSSKSCSSEPSKEVASELSQSVVSLVSIVGDTTVFECTGIFIESSCALATSILTSASLVRSSDDESKISDNLTIKVRLPNAQTVIGLLYHYDLMHDLAVVHIKHAPVFQPAYLCFSHRVQFEPNCMVVAVGRCFTSSMLTGTSGIVIDSLSDVFGELKLSTCKFNMARIGGPLIDFDGNFAGMNLQGAKRTAFVPANKILECLGHLGTIRVGINQGGNSTQETSTTTIQKAATPKNVFECLCEYARRSGYPLPTRIRHEPLPYLKYPFNGMFDDLHQMRVMNSFRDKFGNNILCTVSRDIASTMLEIEVCPPNKGRAIGTLKNYDLSYNVAVVEITGFRSPCAIELEKHISFASNTEVVAVGRLFKDCELMAIKGWLVDRESKLDCKELRVASCKITKAGIGGPLIDTCGNFVGMSFLHEEGTPYLPREKIQELLQSDAKWHSATESNNGGPISWPVPRSYWYLEPPPFDSETVWIY